MLPDPEAVAAALFDPAAAVPASWVRDENPAAWHRPGLLSYWVDDAGRSDLESVLGERMDGGLLAWTAATACHEGEDAVLGTLWGEVALRELGREGFSVLRYKLFAILTPRAAPNQRDLIAWLAEHLFVVGHPLLAEEARTLSQQIRPPTGALLRSSKPATRAQERAEELRREYHEARRAWHAEFERKYAGARAKARELRARRM